MIMWHFKLKGMCIKIGYKNVKTSLPILKKVMFLMQRIDPKTSLLSLLRKIRPLRRMIFMSIPTMLQEYNYWSLTQKNDGLRYNIQITDL